MSTILYERVDPARSIRTRIVRDADSGLPLIIAQTQNARAVADDCARYAQMFDPHRARKQGNRLVAVVPAVIVNHLMKMGIWQDPHAKLAWLSRRDARGFRTDDGRPLVKGTSHE